MRISSKLFFVSALLGLSNMANASLNVFACEPEYAALTKEIAPDANVYSATTAMQDPHQIQARPSLIAKMRRADLAVCAGADLEIGWLPMLQLKSANPKMRNHQTGLFLAAEHTDTLDKLDKVDRSMGDVHAKGNPHVHLDPYRILEIGKALTQRLAQLDSHNARRYQTSFNAFEQKWRHAVKRWERRAEGLKGKKVIAYHSSFRYLFDWLDMEQVGDLEPKPGLAPTTGHLAELLKLTRRQPVAGVIVASYQDERGGQWLAKRADLPLLILPLSVGGNQQSTDLYRLYDDLINQLAGKL